MKKTRWLATAGSLVLLMMMGDAPAATSVANGDIAFAGFRQIYVMDSDGSHVEKITDSEERSNQPAWSPDGTEIAFTCGGGLWAYARSREICVMDPDGGNIVALTDNRRGEQSVAWSPDGSEIAFTRAPCHGSCTAQIWIMDADGTNQHKITDDESGAYDPAWSPDGSVIAFTRDCDIHLIDPDGDNQQNLTSEYATTLDDPCEMAPAWSPDGTQVAYMCLSDSQPYCGSSWWNVWIMDADGSDPYQVTSDEHTGGGSPEWSPNGNRICFTEGSDAQIHTIRTDGTGLRQLTHSDHYRYSCTWQALADN